MPPTTMPQPDAPADTPSTPLETFQALTRRVAFETARKRGYCDTGLDTTLKNLGLPPVQYIKTLTADLQIHPAYRQEQELFTDPAAALVQVAIALHDGGYAGSAVTSLQTITRRTTTYEETPDGQRQIVEDNTAPRTVVTARVTIRVTLRILGVAPTAAERRRATATARNTIATIIADQYYFHATIINVDDVTVGDYYTT